jgi:hypothetical protein
VPEPRIWYRLTDRKPEWLKKPLVRGRDVRVPEGCILCFQVISYGKKTAQSAVVQIPSGTYRTTTAHTPSGVNTAPHNESTYIDQPLGFFIPGCHLGDETVQLAWRPEGPYGRWYISRT